MYEYILKQQRKNFRNKFSYQNRQCENELTISKGAFGDVNTAFFIGKQKGEVSLQSPLVMAVLHHTGKLNFRQQILMGLKCALKQSKLLQPLMYHTIGQSLNLRSRQPIITKPWNKMIKSLLESSQASRPTESLSISDLPLIRWRAESCKTYQHQILFKIFFFLLLIVRSLRVYKQTIFTLTLQRKHEAENIIIQIDKKKQNPIQYQHITTSTK